MEGTGVLGMGVVFEIRDAFSRQANQIGRSLNGLQSQAQQMATAVNSSMRSTVDTTEKHIRDAQGRLRDANGRFLSMGSKGYTDAIKSGMIDMEKALSDSMSKMQNATMGLFAGVAMLSPFALAINKAREFEAQLSNIKSLGVLQQDMAKVEGLAMEMGAKTKFSALESAQGIEELLKAGVKLEAIMNKNGLSGALDLAVAGNLKLADAAEIASTALNAFNKDGMTIRDAGNILAGAANASATDVMTLKFSLSAVSAVASGVGLSFMDTSKALAVFANNGLKGSDAGTSLKAMLMNLQPRSNAQMETFQQLGLITANGANAFFDAAGNIKSMADIAGILNTKLKHLNPQQRAFALETMFGSDAVRAGNILYKEGAQGINDMAKEMTKFTAASVAKERLNNFNGSVEMLMGSIDTILIQIGKMFLPYLTKIVQGVNFVVDAFQSLISTEIGRYLVLASAAAASFIVVFGAVIPFIQTTIGVMRVLAVVATQTALAFAPYIAAAAAIAVVVALAYKSLRSFQDYLEGTEKPAQGLLGVMQKLGAMMWTVGQVISSWDGKTFNLGGNEAKLQALGVLDTVKSLATWVVRFVELSKGVGVALYNTYTNVSYVVGTAYKIISSGINSFLKYFGLQNTAFAKGLGKIQDWVSVGKTLGYIIGGVLVFAVTTFTASLGIMVAGITLAISPILAIVWAVRTVISAITDWRGTMKSLSSNFTTVAAYLQSRVQMVANYFKNNFLSDVSNVFAYLRDNIPVWAGNAFSAFLSVTKYYMTQIVPFVISSWYNLFSWVVTNTPAWIQTALVTAFEWGKWYVTQVMGGFISIVGNFLWWAVTNIPIFIVNAWTYAFTMSYELFTKFFTNIGNTFYEIGTSIMNSLWEGMKSIWNSVAEWWDSTMSSLGLGSVMGTQVETANSLREARSLQLGTNTSVDSGFVPRSSPSSEIGRTMADIEVLRQRQSINNTTNIQGGSETFTINLDLGDGDTISRVVEKQQMTKNSRK